MAKHTKKNYNLAWNTHTYQHLFGGVSYYNSLSLIIKKTMFKKEFIGGGGIDAHVHFLSLSQFPTAFQQWKEGEVDHVNY